MTTFECESVRGEWGGICPDCGEQMPSRPLPLASWQSSRAPTWRFGTVSGGGWTPETRPGRMAAHRARQGATERQLEVRRIVDKHGGNQAAAARELGVSSAAVSVSLKRMGVSA